MSNSPIRVFSVDDHPLLREGIAALVNNQPDMVLAAQASTGAEAIQVFRQQLPDVTLLDLRLPDMSGIDILIAIRSEFPEARIIMLTTFEGDVEIQRALQAGARGYLLKNAHKDEIVEAIKAVKNGLIYYCDGASAKLTRMIAKNERIPFVRRVPRPEFSVKEINVIQYICQEMTNKEIADKLNLSIRTIEGYRDRILEKIGARNSAGIVVYAIRNNIYNI